MRSKGTISRPEPKPVNPLIRKAAVTIMLDRINICRAMILPFFADNLLQSILYSRELSLSRMANRGWEFLVIFWVLEVKCPDHRLRLYHGRDNIFCLRGGSRTFS